MKDIAFTGLEHTIFTWNIAHAGNIFIMFINATQGEFLVHNRLFIFQFFAKTKDIILIGRRTAVTGLHHFEHQMPYFLL